MEKSNEIRNYIEYIRGRKVIERDFIDLNEMLFRNDFIPLYFSNDLNNTASFNPNYKRISINIDRVDDWANGMVRAASSFYEIDDLELTKAYFIVQMYKHELEHVKQFLIANDQIATDYEFIRQVYKDLFDFLLVKDFKITSLATNIKDIRKFRIYKKNPYMYILERNADIESYDYLSRVAMDSGDDNILQLMINCRNSSILIGYTDDGEGCIKKTYESLHMKSKYGKINFPSSLSIIERARYGMELDEKSRTSLVKTLKSTIKYK